MNTIFMLSVLAMLAPSLASAVTHPVGSNTPQVAARATCMAHISRIDAMLERGLTKEQILADFETWLAQTGSVPITDRYPDMVRAMIASAKLEGWPEDAYRACIEAFKAN